MRTIAVEQARAALAEAKADRAHFEVDTTEEIEQFRVGWARFLMACSRVYSKLEQGAKAEPKSVAWFGRKKHDRRTDPLLRYLHHAQDVDYHGVEYVAAVQPGRVHVFAAQPGDVAIEQDGETIRITALREGVRVDHTSPYYRLIDVTDVRYGDTFKVPKEHLGKPIDPWPAPVAEAAIAYLDGMIAEAGKLPQVS